MKYTVILEKGRESGYVASVAFRLRKAVAYCPALKGCVSQGKTK